MAQTTVLLLLAVIYAYFSLGIDNDPQACWAPNSLKETEIVEEQQVRIFGDEGYDDVGDQFRTCFDVMFYVTWAQLIAISIRTLVLGDDQRSKAKARYTDKVLILIFFVCRIASFVITITALRYRYRHSGQVCSGDFLEATDAP